MKVIVTLDRWDGSHLVRECEAEAVSRMLLLWLTEKGVAGVTITRRDPLKKIALHTEEGWNK